LADVEALVRDRKLACKDTSARALMREARARRADTAPEVRADGVDATSAASSKAGWSARETNPQVRLSCEGTASDVIGDRARPAAVGRLLFVFDSPAHPLRHVSFRRLNRDGAAAGLDVASARDAAVAALGAPAEESGALPEGGGFAPYVPWTAAWRWADLTVTVRALSYGDRGVDVYEAAEVPWPVRSDAPALARAAFARGAKQ
ncbi:hypothetical protein L6R52_39920, partial [Myxococcota bacterium]|nr:hypothetical protein [Myxococcota bacterium]